LKLAFLILFNLVTAVGGHFVNRRWDKAFLLFVAMLLILSLPWFYLLMASAGFNDLMSFKYYPYVQLGIILCFSLLSTSLFVIDYRKPGETAQVRWTRTMTAAAGVFCLVSTFYLGWFVYSYLISAQLFYSSRDSVAQEKGDVAPRKTFFRDNYFSDYIYFSFDGGDVSNPMPAPPPGDAVLYGTIVHNGAPVAGIKLDVVLGGEYKVESLVTDADGMFSFSVAPWSWKIDAILVKGWSDKPKGEYDQNNRKIVAAETLLESRLVAEAEKIVALITENSRAGKIDALKGYILAIQGDCAQANLHFDKAIKDGGISCLPQKYRQNCL